MSSLLFLNERLTQEQAMQLHKQQFDGWLELMKTFEANALKIEDPKSRMDYINAMWPIIMQQWAMCL